MSYAATAWPSAAHAQVTRVLASTRPVSLNELAPGSLFSTGTRTPPRLSSACQIARSEPFPSITSASKPGRPLLDEVSVHPAVVRACPHDHDVGEAAVADPALRPVDHEVVAVAPRGRLERDGVRAVEGLGQRERAELLEPRHGRQPVRLLLVRSEHRDRLHRETGMDAEEGADAPVAAVELHVHQPAGDRIEAGAAVAGDVLADHAELAEPPDQRPGHLRPLPVAGDRRQHLPVDERADTAQGAELLLGELLAQEEVIGRAGVGETGGQLGGRGGHAALATGAAITSAPSPRRTAGEARSRA